MMMIAVVVLVLAGMGGRGALALGQMVTWTRDHQQCTTVISPGSAPREARCEDLAYARYFQGILASTKADEYHKQIASAVMSLYSDLKESKKPYLFTHPHNSSRSFPIHPITFCLPEENILSTIPHKSKPFGRVIPGIQSTYYHLYNESHYFEDMARSLYTITYKKGGWDCLRHYEILAAGSLPLFMQIRHCPPHALALHPKKLYDLILQQPGLTVHAKRTGQMTMQFDVLDMDLSKLDHTLYNALVSSMLHYTRNVFSTKAMAQYVLETMYANSQGLLASSHPSSLLYLTHQDRDMDKGDYMTDFLLHGLKKLLGEQRVTDFPARDGLYKTTKAFNTSHYLEERSKLYGAGFSWGMKIDVLSGDNARDRGQVQRNLEEHKYDIVILGSGHRDGWASKLFFWDLVCKHYHPLQVGFVDGADYHLRLRTIDKYSPCAGHFFSREGYSVK